MLTAKPIAAQVKYDFAQLGNSSFFTKYGHENEMYNVGVEVKEGECL